jgi:heat shock protein HslJ
MISCKKESVESASTSMDALSTTDFLGQWKFKGYSDGKMPVYDVTIEFKKEEGKYSLNGRSSVNFYFASFETNENTKTMKISAIGSTKMAGMPEANQFETVYYERLQNLERYEFKDKNVLALYLSNPVKEVMYFERK